MPSSVIVALAALAFLALAGACVNGFVSGADFFASFGAVSDNPWGLTMLVDLNAAFVFCVVVVWLLEPKRGVALLVTVTTPLLGSFVPLAWLIARAGLLKERLGR
jgi:hypothetical protein